MHTQPMVLLKGLEWHKSDVALKKLKEMLWGLEALRVFDDKLGKALQKIDEAKEVMTKKAQWVSHGNLSTHQVMCRRC
jgi:hypothetical protein